MVQHGSAAATPILAFPHARPSNLHLGNRCVRRSFSGPNVLGSNGLHSPVHACSDQRNAMQCSSASAFSKKVG